MIIEVFINFMFLLLGIFITLLYNKIKNDYEDIKQIENENEELRMLLEYEKKN
jgi:hypothetical protein